MGEDLGGGQVDLLLLAVLRSGPAHGYAVIAALRDRSSGAFDLAEGTVYPALHRLEGAGLAVSARETVQGRQRRIYSITRKGRTALRRGERDWERSVGQIRAVLAMP